MEEELSRGKCKLRRDKQRKRGEERGRQTKTRKETDREKQAYPEEHQN